MIVRAQVEHHLRRNRINGVRGDAHAVAIATVDWQELLARGIRLKKVRLELTIAHEGLQLFRIIPVNALRKIPISRVINLEALQVVLAARQIGQGHLGQQLHRGGIEPGRRNEIAGKRRARAAGAGRGQRIKDRANDPIPG